MNVEIPYAVGSKVKIADRQIIALVLAVTVYSAGRMRYLVSWWSDGKRSEEWLNEEEVER